MSTCFWSNMLLQKEQATVKEVNLFVKFVIEDLKMAKFEYFFQEIQRVDVKNADIILCIAFLRSTFVWRNKIGYWETFLRDCDNEFKRKGLNKNLLKGLL